MIDRQHRTTIMARAVRVLAMMALLLTGWFGAAPGASAQESIPLTIAAKSCDGSGISGSCWNEIGAQFTVTTQDGVFLGSCTLEGPPNVGIVLSCAVPVPDGLTVVVTEDVSTITPGYEPEENPIIFDTAAKPAPPNVPSFWGPIFHNSPQSGPVGTGQTSDIAIAPTENGASVTDACFVLVDYSNEGCDENRDGQVTFADIPLGTYTVRQTADLGPGRAISDVTIQVTGGGIGPSGYEVFPALVSSGSGDSSFPIGPGGSVDIALITRDPQDGHLLTDTCYVLVDYSNEGCDENADGQVTFAAIPYGTYTVRQTRVPAGFPRINDFEIDVEPVTGMPGSEPFGVPLGFVVKQAPEQNAPDTRNVSVVLLDMRTHERVEAGICVELVDASNVGCDEDLVDGQVDFLDVPAGGPYELRFSNLPAGYEVGTVGGPLAVQIDAGPDAPANRMIFVLLSVPQSSAPAASPEKTWNASVQVNLCDAPPNSGLEMNCHAEAGIVVNVSLASGERLGSCAVGQPQPTPWNTSISTCAVEGLPFNADFVATQDPSTIPAGYEPHDNSLTLHVGDLYPGGGDQATFTFFNVRTGAGTSTIGPSGTGSTGEATALMTFRGCPEGFNPYAGNFYAECTIPLDAPDASVIAGGSDTMSITWLDRQYNGAYIYNAGPGTMNLQLSGMAPVLRDAYQVVGADWLSGDIYTVNLADGETREIFVFYYFE